jgi:carbonic anhydrase
MITYEQIFENNKKWIASKRGEDADFFAKLSKQQEPDYLYIGCSDSRVTAEEVAGFAPGEVFVHRNVANIISNNDLNLITVLNYAVQHLGVKHIVVCGHYLCGGVKAAMTKIDMGIMNPWLRNIRDVYRLHMNELNAIENEQVRYDRLVELNVQEQCFNVMKIAMVQHLFTKKGYPHVHGWVFDVRSGELKDLKLDFNTIFKDYRDIYTLTKK